MAHSACNGSRANQRASRDFAGWALAILLLLAFALPASAHDTPGETRVRALVKVEGERLHVLLRLPLALMLNIDLPKQGPGYLALGQVDEGLERAVRAADTEIAWYADGQRLTLVDSAARITEPSDTSFGSFDAARALVQGPRLPDTAFVFWNQGYLDAHLQYRIESARPALAVDFQVAPALRDRVRLDLRYTLPDGVERVFDLPTAQGQAALDPRWYQAAWTFLKSGFAHILGGPDHLLFLLCLILPFRRIDLYLVGVVTAFTVAHSVTLIGAAYGLAPAVAWFSPLVETLIAASILFMAVENVVLPSLQRRWIASALFGLVHGFGFAFLLQTQLQFAGSNLLLSLLAFNVGVELGQLLVLLLVLPALAVMRSLWRAAERAIDIVVCVLAGHVAWHWMVERAEQYAAAADADHAVLLAAALLVLALLRLAWRWHRRASTAERAGRVAP